MGPERRFRSRLRTRRWVREVNVWNEPWRSRSSRTSRETLLWRQETPVQEEQGSVLEFQVVSLLEESEEALNAMRASKSGFSVEP